MRKDQYHNLVCSCSKDMFVFAFKLRFCSAYFSRYVKASSFVMISTSYQSCSGKTKLCTSADSEHKIGTSDMLIEFDTAFFRLVNISLVTNLAETCHTVNSDIRFDFTNTYNKQTTSTMSFIAYQQYSDANRYICSLFLDVLIAAQVFQIPHLLLEMFFLCCLLTISLPKHAKCFYNIPQKTTYQHPIHH